MTLNRRLRLDQCNNLQPLLRPPFITISFPLLTASYLHFLLRVRCSLRQIMDSLVMFQVIISAHSPLPGKHCVDIPVTSRQALSARANPSGFHGFDHLYPHCPPSRIDTPVPGLTDGIIRTKFDTASNITVLIERAVHEIACSGVTVYQALQQIARDALIPSSILC